jgi:hypothetical protein
MASNTKNKYPADKAGTKYSEFRNTRRVTPGKSRSDAGSRQQSTTEAADKSA